MAPLFGPPGNGPRAARGRGPWALVYLVGRFLLRGRGRTERAEDGLPSLCRRLLLGTVGGFGSCSAFCVTPMIRC